MSASPFTVLHYDFSSGSDTACQHFMLANNSPHLHKILTWLWGFLVKKSKFSNIVLSEYPDETWYKENNTKYRSLTRKPLCHVWILIYWSWTTKNFTQINIYFAFISSKWQWLRLGRWHWCCRSNNLDLSSTKNWDTKPPSCWHEEAKVMPHYTHSQQMPKKKTWVGLFSMPPSSCWEQRAERGKCLAHGAAYSVQDGIHQHH